MKKYPFLYVAPITQIFKKLKKTGKWPRQWVKEETIILSKLDKTKLPNCEDDLGSISKTAWVSKLCENILGSYILPVIYSFLDPGQCGGLRKSSNTHYMVMLLDKRTPMRQF